MILVDCIRSFVGGLPWTRWLALTIATLLAVGAVVWLFIRAQGLPAGLDIIDVTAAREGSTLIVSGQVHSSWSNDTPDLTVEVFLYDSHGTPLGDESEHLGVLAPGAAAPFSVKFDGIALSPTPPTEKVYLHWPVHFLPGR